MSQTSYLHYHYHLIRQNLCGVARLVFVRARSYLENAKLCLLSRNLQKIRIILMFLFIFNFWSMDLCETLRRWGSDVSSMDNGIQKSGANWKQQGNCTNTHSLPDDCASQRAHGENHCWSTHSIKSQSLVFQTSLSNLNSHTHRNTSSCISELQTPADN